MEDQIAELRGALNMLMSEWQSANQAGFEAREARESRERENGYRRALSSCPSYSQTAHTASFKRNIRPG